MKRKGSVIRDSVCRLASQGLGDCLLGFREVQSEALNRPADNTVFGGRIGTKVLPRTAKEGQQLSGGDIDDGTVLASQAIQTLAFDRHVVVPDQFGQDRLADNHFHEPEFFLVQFAQPIGFVQPETENNRKI